VTHASKPPMPIGLIHVVCIDWKDRYDRLTMEGPMSRQDVIDRIKRINISARDDFLGQFDDESLQQYLQRLQATYGEDAEAVVLTVMPITV